MGEKKDYKRKKEEEVTLVRVLGRDIRGDIKIKSALTKVNGISWAISNAVCKILELNISKKKLYVVKLPFTENEELASKFLKDISSEKGKRILKKYGF